MASLLVYVKAKRIRSIVPVRERGAVWPMRASDFHHAELDRLDDQSTLFVVTVEDDRAVLVACLDGPQIGRDALGDASVCDDDITHLLPRLGCERASDLPAWANLPRVLPPGDVDLLMYRPRPALAVALPAPPPPPPPMQIISDDPIAARLLAAIYDDLGSDVARMVYADHLQEQGDPRGELIALQLARHGSGQPASDREQDLVATCGAACVGPLAPYLRPNFVLRRGFLAACAVAQPAIPDAIVRDLAWSTVEQLHTTTAALLASPTLVSASRVGVDGQQLARAIGCEHELPVEVLVGYRSEPELGPAIDQPGLMFSDEVWDELDGVGAFARLRAMSVSVNSIDPDRVSRLPRTRLGKQLRHLDVSLGMTPVPDAERWRRAFDRSPLHRLTLRCKLDIVRRARRPGDVVGPWNLPDVGRSPNVCIALERMTGPHRLVVQLDRPIGADLVTPVARLIAPFGRRIERIEVQDLGAPERVAERQRDVMRALEPMFARVMPTVGPLLAP